MKANKKLVLTISDDTHAERKLTISHFLETIDPMDFSDHLEALPGLDQLIQPKMNRTSSTYCKHAHYVETNHYPIFRHDI